MVSKRGGERWGGYQWEKEEGTAEESEHASKRDRETEPRIDRPAENYPLAGDFAVCERPITYESSQWGALSRCARGPTRIPPVPHARRGHAATRVSFIVDVIHRRRPRRRSHRCALGRAAFGGVRFARRRSERSEVRHVLVVTCILHREPVIHRYRVVFCYRSRSFRSRHENRRIGNSVSCALWRTTGPPERRVVPFADYGWHETRSLLGIASSVTSTIRDGVVVSSWSLLTWLSSSIYIYL